MTPEAVPHIMPPEAADGSPGEERACRHVLLCAAMCHPDMGSEFAVGWQWVCQAARHHRVTVIAGDARGARHAVERALASRPELAAAATFVFLPWFDPPASKLIQAAWTKVPFLYYWLYRRWLRRAAAVAREIVARERIDLVHLVTLTCYREPGAFGNLNRPFVWGPVGGTQDVPWAFLPSLGLVEGGKHAARNVVNWCLLRAPGGVPGAMRQAAAVAAMASDSQQTFQERFGRESVVIPATACSDDVRRSTIQREADRGIRFVFSGHHISRKGLPFALYALADLRDLSWTFDVLGDGPLTDRWKRLARRLGIADRVRFLGRLPRADAVRAMAEADVFVFPTLQEGWPTVVIEALSLGLPVVTTKHHGMVDMIDSESGVFVRVDRPAHLVDDLRESLRSLATDRGLVERLSAGARRRAECLDESRQETAIRHLYERALGSALTGGRLRR